MKQQSNTVTAIAGALLLALIGTACSSRNPAEQRLPLHPARESRMSDKPRPGYVATNVWRVKGHNGNLVYLMGTCHQIQKREIPFPSSYYAAYQDSQDVFLEVDDHSLAVKCMTLSALPTGLGFYAKHYSELNNPDGRTLSDELSPKTIKLLRAHYGGDYAEKEKLTPLGLLLFHELMSDVDSGGGVDDYFNQLAYRDDKKTRSLDGFSVVGALKPVMESAIEQARNDIAAKGADTAVEEAILEKSADDSSWRYGITDRDAAKELDGMKKESPELYEMLLPRRNQQWLQIIRHSLQGKRNAVVLVGALHLPGPDGLLVLLRRDGYHPLQMFGVDHPKLAHSPG